MSQPTTKRGGRKAKSHNWTVVELQMLLQLIEERRPVSSSEWSALGTTYNSIHQSDDRRRTVEALKSAFRKMHSAKKQTGRPAMRALEARAKLVFSDIQTKSGASTLGDEEDSADEQDVFEGESDEETRDSKSSPTASPPPAPFPPSSLANAVNGSSLLSVFGLPMSVPPLVVPPLPQPLLPSLPFAPPPNTFIIPKIPPPVIAAPNSNIPPPSPAASSSVSSSPISKDFSSSSETPSTPSRKRFIHEQSSYAAKPTGAGVKKMKLDEVAANLVSTVTDSNSSTMMMGCMSMMMQMMQQQQQLMTAIVGKLGNTNYLGTTHVHPPSPPQCGLISKDMFKHYFN